MKIYPSEQAPRITVITPAPLKKWLQRYAKKNDVSVSHILITLIKELKAKAKNERN